MKEEPALPDYVLRYLNDERDQSRKDRFEEWLAKEENRAAFIQMKKVWTLADDLDKFDRFDLQEGKREISRKINRAKQVRLIRTFQKAAAFLLLPALILGGWLFLQNRTLTAKIAPAGISQQIQTQPGVRSSFVLPDGSKVWLNSASTLRFPSSFSGHSRSVELEGEAYFEVAKNPRLPFIVRSGTLKVTALGTAFNMCAYPDDREVSATLAEGKIKVNTDATGRNPYILEPGEQLEFEKKSLKVHIQQVRPYEAIAWKDGKLIFNERPFHEVVRKLGRWFNTDIRLADESIANYRYTATFTNENLAQVMELLTFSAPITYSVNDRIGGRDNSFSPKQIIIRVKTGSTQKTATKNNSPM